MAYTAVADTPEPLLNHTDSWKSATDYPDTVQQLLQEEFDAGFIAIVPGGLPELQRQYNRTAVGKLGLVLAPGRSPRLVVDSSISNVTANTQIPITCCCPELQTWWHVHHLKWPRSR